MRRRILLLCTVVLLLAILSAGSMAYFTAAEKAQNVITTGSVALEVHQIGVDGEVYPEETLEIMPGDTLVNTVTVENTGNHPFWLRVKVTKRVKDSQLSAEGMVLDLNTRDWSYRDGYYYYNAALQAGEVTEPLFTQVSFDGKTIGNEYLGKVFTLDVDAYGVQSENNADTVWEASGWPEA